MKEPLVNYTQGFNYVWHEIPVLVTFESDWRATKGILAQIGDDLFGGLSLAAAAEIQRAAERFLIVTGPLAPTVYTTVKDSGVLLTLRFMCLFNERRLNEQRVWEAVLDAFAARDDIDLAYPTTRYYDNRSEGKPGYHPAAQ
jgi:small-conductance mechanosensitive channel